MYILVYWGKSSKCAPLICPNALLLEYLFLYVYHYYHLSFYFTAAWFCCTLWTYLAYAICCISHPTSLPFIYRLFIMISAVPPYDFLVTTTRYNYDLIYPFISTLFSCTQYLVFNRSSSSWIYLSILSPTLPKLKELLNSSHTVNTAA